MKKIFIFTMLLSTLYLISPSAFCYGKGTDVPVDQILRSANLTTLIGQDYVVNLIAQTKDGSISTRLVNNLDDFVVLGVPANDDRTEIAEFDQNQKIIRKESFGAPWMGVDNYTQKEIPETSLQAGLDALKTCIAKKNVPIPDEITSVIVYKDLQSNSFIYDYIFKNPTTNLCHEYAYVPANNTCFVGNPHDCHFMYPEAWTKRQGK